MSSSRDFWLGSPGKIQQQSTLGKEQQGLYQQLLGSAGGPQGGAFGQAGDYYRDLLSNRGGDFEAFAAPEMRRFKEDIIPSLAEQFAGGGYGGIGGSGFRNAATRAGTDLSERLGSIRAGLRQSAAQGLMGIGQQGLGNYNENFYMQPTMGFLPSLSIAGANAAGSAIGTGAGMALGKKWGG
jgi:hypothetical protein